ncbi:MAG: phage tail tape measure protein [Pseudomonadota bacterium]
MDEKILITIAASDAGAEAKLAATAASIDKVSGSAGRVGKSTDEAGQKMDSLAGKSEKMGGRIGGVFSKLGQEANNWGIPFGGVLDTMGKKMEATSSKGSSNFDKLAGAGKIATVGIVAGFVGASAEAVHWADAQDKAAGSVAASANISTEAARQIGDSFAKVGADLRFNSTEITNAYAGVAGQLGSVAGQALSTADADKVMAASADLAAAKHISLAEATGADAKVMQEFHLGADKANSVTTDLLNTSNSMGISVSAAAGQIQRMGSSMGYAKGTAGDLSAFMIDLANHGEAGRGAMSAAQAAINKLLTTAGGPDSKAATAATKNLASATAGVDKAKQELANKEAEYASKGALSVAQTQALANAQDKVNVATAKYGASSTQAVAARKHLSDLQAVDASKAGLSVSNQIALQHAHDAVAAAQAKQAVAQQAVTSAGVPANAAAKAMGITLTDQKGDFVGMGSVIDQLSPKIKGMGKQQADAYLQTLLGAAASRKLLDTIEAGPAAWNAAEAAVTSGQTAHEAATKATANLDDQVGVLGKDIHNLGTSYGEWLTPKLTEAGKVAGGVLSFFEKNKTAAEALAVVVGGALTLAVSAFAYKTVAGVVKNIGDMFGGVQKMASKIPGLGGDTTLAAEGETAATSLDTAATNIKEAASALNQAAAKLSEAGAQTAGELDTAGATVGGEITTGASEAAVTLDAAGAEVATEIDAGATTAAAELDAAGATVASEEAAGGLGAGAGISGVGGATIPLVGAAIVGHQMSENKAKHDPAYAKKVNDLKKNYPSMPDTVVSIAHTVAGWFGGGSSKPKSAPSSQFLPSYNAGGGVRLMDEGGIVTGPTLAGLALNSRPEVVMPLSDLATYLARQPTPAGSASDQRGVVFQPGSVQLLAVPMTAQEAASELAWQLRKV